MRSAVRQLFTRVGSAFKSEGQPRSFAKVRRVKAKRSRAMNLVSAQEVLPPVAVPSRSLTQHSPDQSKDMDRPLTPGKAQCAMPSPRSGAAAAECGSRYKPLRAPGREHTTPGHSTDVCVDRKLALQVFEPHTDSGLPEARPNPSLKLTRYGKRCKPGLRQSYYRRSPGLQRSPPRAA